eukprot:GHVS01016665.1.p1 GENE.GHVS01016665.1~~GHVS01016665.1.p1  ORF type:complete len:470 (+),score=53.91 GHVS01016665.1:141-1550(+)
MANLLSHKMMPICKWSSLFILALLAILPSGTTAAPATAQEEVAVAAMKGLCSLYSNPNRGVGGTRKRIDALHEAAAAAEIDADSDNPWMASLTDACAFPDGKGDTKQLLMKETAELYQNAYWPQATVARERATELVDAIEVAEVLKSGGSLDEVKLKLDKQKLVASTTSTDGPMKQTSMDDASSTPMYSKTSVQISKQFNRAVHNRTSKMSNTDYADKIDVLGGLLGMSTELTCGLYRDLVETRKRFANVSDPSQMLKLIRVNVAMSSNPQICESLAKVRFAIVHRIRRAINRNIERMVGLIKDVPSGIGFHNNVVNCMNWWSTERAWTEIHKQPKYPQKHDTAAFERIVWPLYHELAELLVDDESTRIKEKEDFIREAFGQIVSEVCFRDFEWEDWKGSKRGRVPVILEVKKNMHQTLKELLLKYMSDKDIQNDDLKELATEKHWTEASAETAVDTWNKHKHVLTAQQ